MKRRDLVALGGAVAALLGIWGAFSIWWALIVGGLLVVALVVALTLGDATDA